MTGDRVPRYQQLKELVIERISSGELRPSDRVPSEHELVESTGVSRMTANRALRELEKEGYVNRIAGVGTFVADLRVTSQVLEVRSIAEEVLHRGHVHSARVLKLERVRAGKSVAAGLQLAPGTLVNHALLVHFENDQPIQVEDRYVAQDFATDFLNQDFTTITPSAYLSGIAPLQEAEHVVQAAMPDDTVRRQLGMSDRQPCLVVTRRTWANGAPATFTRLYHPGNRFELAGHYTPPGTPKSDSGNTLRNIANES